MASFGWIPPTDEKQADNDRYELRSLQIAAPALVERSFTYNLDWIDEQDQGNIGACVGYACSWAMSHYNTELYNSYWLYKRAQAVDGDPRTRGDQDGTYLFAAGDVLRKEGHALYKTTAPERVKGIESYYWCKTIDDIRTAADLGRPPVFGIPWFSEFNDPSIHNGELWIGKRASWGAILGGHAIWCQAVSDQRLAVALLNTWGKSWAGGKPVWIGYKAIEKLFSYRGECMAMLDYAPVPPPPVEKQVITLTGIDVEGKKWSGVLTKQ